MSEFEKLFKSRTTVQLLRIIGSPEDYSKDALLAAQKEFVGRTDKDEAREYINEENELKEDRKARGTKIEGQIEKSANSVLDLIDPLRSGITPGEKRLKWLIILFAGLSIYQLVKEFSFMNFMFTDASAEWDMSVLLYFLPLMIVPLGTYLLYKKNKIGWGLLYAWSIVNCYGSLRTAVVMWDYAPRDFHVIDMLMPQPSSVQLILGSLVVGVFIIALLNRHIRDLLELDKHIILTWTAIGMVLPTLSFFL